MCNAWPVAIPGAADSERIDFSEARKYMSAFVSMRKSMQVFKRVDTWGEEERDKGS
jgi:hypothetical protein